MSNALETARFILCAGFASWLFVNVANHLRDFPGTLRFVAAFMRMAPLDQEPAIPTPLKSRRVERPAIHRVATIAITVSQAVLGIAFAFAAYQFAIGRVAEGRVAGTYAFAGLAALWFAFLIGGTWFGYWLRQGDLQRTHLLLLAIAMLGLAMMGA